MALQDCVEYEGPSILVLQDHLVVATLYHQIAFIQSFSFLQYKPLNNYSLSSMILSIYVFYV